MHRIRLSVFLALVALLVAVPAANAASPSLVVSQVYAAGGNAGASYVNDYVELFNRGGTAVDLTGWSVQYASAASTSWQAVPLTGSIAAGKRYLVQLASSGTVGAALPAADATGTANLAVSGGKVAVVHDLTALTCGATAGSCSAVASVGDLLGYGSATDYEGSAAAGALGATTAAARASGGCADTDANAVDFTVAAASPSNSAAAAAVCSGAGSSSALVQSASVAIEIEPVLSIALEQPTIDFGKSIAGGVPTPVSEKVTVVSNNPAGYSVTVHRSAFTPFDLPLGIAVAGSALTPIPVAPALDLLIGTSNGKSSAGGDVWNTSLGFPALPSVASGRYSSSVTFTAIAR